MYVHILLKTMISFNIWSRTSIKKSLLKSISFAKKTALLNKNITPIKKFVFEDVRPMIKIINFYIKDIGSDQF